MLEWEERERFGSIMIYERKREGEEFKMKKKNWKIYMDINKIDMLTIWQGFNGIQHEVLSKKKKTTSILD